MTKLYQNPEVAVIGGGLAGCEAAWQLAQAGFRVRLYEMRPSKMTEAHKTGFLGEMVCSNSLKSESLDSANGLLKEELKLLGSFIIDVALKTRVPSGGALSVDREKFAQTVTKEISNHSNIEVVNEEVTKLDFNIPTIVATGPLTSEYLSKELTQLFDGKLYFYDAVSPVIDAESIDFSKAFFKSRYDKGEPDYLNCPMTKNEFFTFYEALMGAEKVEFEDFEKSAVFERCMPIEEIAKRGEKTLTFGPMRPVGLRHPITEEKYYAVVQLRKENLKGTAYNVVGFQTKMKIHEQKRVFRLIPGLENAEFLRFGSVHRNTYVKSPGKLNRNYRLKDKGLVYIAGQVSGVEGYVESIASGLNAGMDMCQILKWRPEINFPDVTAMNALGSYVSAQNKGEFSPSNFHFGMLPPLAEKIRDKSLRKEMMSKRALEAIKDYILTIRHES